MKHTVNYMKIYLCVVVITLCASFFETLITGIGQGYFQSTPLQLCLMMAQLANGGYEIKPRIIDDKYALQPIIDAWREEFTFINNNLD